MATAPVRKPTLASPQPKAPAPEIPDFGDELEDTTDDLYKVFATETITPPPVKTLGRQGGQGLKLPFDKLDAVNKWFLVPPFPVDKEARKKEKQRISSYVYKKRQSGHKFKLIEIDERFANAIKHPELVGRYGVWRVA